MTPSNGDTAPDGSALGRAAQVDEKSREEISPKGEDLVERLREHATRYHHSDSSTSTHSVLLQAAEEITRLRSLALMVREGGSSSADIAAQGTNSLGPSAQCQSEEAAAFLSWIADRFQAQAGCARYEAEMHASATLDEFLQSEGVEVGHADYDWSRDGANTLADEEMSVWEEG